MSWITLVIIAIAIIIAVYCFYATMHPEVVEYHHSIRIALMLFSIIICMVAAGAMVLAFSKGARYVNDDLMEDYTQRTLKQGYDSALREKFVLIDSVYVIRK
jgi:uncharacterized membrane protein (UPF0182 family)